MVEREGRVMRHVSYSVYLEMTDEEVVSWPGQGPVGSVGRSVGRWMVDDGRWNSVVVGRPVGREGFGICVYLISCIGCGYAVTVQSDCDASQGVVGVGAYSGQSMPGV